MADTELLPCPFCGSEHVALIHNTSSDHRYDWDFAVECECGAKGESDKSEEHAAIVWNRRAALASRPAEVDDWISVDDERKPVLGEVLLLYVRTLTCGYIDGIPCEGEGAEIAMGEYRWGDESEYFNCYTSPISDYDWITHWRKLPAAPSHTTNKDGA